MSDDRTDRLNRLLEVAASNNRVAASVDRAADSMNLMRQSVDRREVAADERERAWIDALLKVNERLAVLDRGVQQVDHGVDEVREKTGKYPLAELRRQPISNRPSAYIAVGGWRIPLDGTLWRVLRLLLPLLAGGGLGVLARHLMQ
jgi:hypothetical protein